MTRDHLAKWLSDPANAFAIRGNVMPVLFPFDLFFLCALGLFLGTSSLARSGRVIVLSTWPIWVPWLFPALYMAIDLAEDIVIALIFKRLLALTDLSYGALRVLTAIKITTVTLAIVQVCFSASPSCCDGSLDDVAHLHFLCSRVRLTDFIERDRF